MTLQDALGRLVKREDLSRAQMSAVMRQVMSGDASDAQVGGLLVALQMKGETIDEIAGAAAVMRELANAAAAMSRCTGTSSSRVRCTFLRNMRRYSIPT